MTRLFDSSPAASVARPQSAPAAAQPDGRAAAGAEPTPDPLSPRPGRPIGPAQTAPGSVSRAEPGAPSGPAPARYPHEPATARGTGGKPDGQARALRALDRPGAACEAKVRTETCGEPATHVASWPFTKRDGAASRSTRRLCPPHAARYAVLWGLRLPIKGNA